MSEQIERIVLWRHPESEHARWLRMRMGDRTYAELVRKQDAIIAGAQADGIDAVIVAASVDEMLDACKRLGVEPDQQGRSLAIVAIDAHREGVVDEIRPEFPWGPDGRCTIRATLADLAEEDGRVWRRLGFDDRGQALGHFDDLAAELVQRLRLPQAAAYLAAANATIKRRTAPEVVAARNALIAVAGATAVEITFESDDPDDPNAGHDYPEVRFLR